jgi:hypothetical protein
MNNNEENINQENKITFSEKAIDLIVNGYGNIVLSSREKKICLYCKDTSHTIITCEHPDRSVLKENIIDNLYILMPDDREFILSRLKKIQLKVICSILFIPINGLKSELIERILLFIDWRIKISEYFQNKMNKIKINKKKKEDFKQGKELTCPICLDDFSFDNVDKLYETQCCEQLFCEMCITTHLKCDEERRCPLCRQDNIKELNNYSEKLEEKRVLILK